MSLSLVIDGSAPFAVGLFGGWAFARSPWVAIGTALVIALVLGAVLVAHVSGWPPDRPESTGGDFDLPFGDFLIFALVAPFVSGLLGIEAGIGITRLVRQARTPHLR